MISENPSRSERLEKAERAQRVGSTIHEVAHGLEGVLRGVEAKNLEEVFEFLPTSLDVADEELPGHRGVSASWSGGCGPWPRTSPGPRGP